MTSSDDEPLREIWTGQAVPALLMTPEQLRERAGHRGLHSWAEPSGPRVLRAGRTRVRVRRRRPPRPVDPPRMPLDARLGLAVHLLATPLWRDRGRVRRSRFAGAYRGAAAAARAPARHRALLAMGHRSGHSGDGAVQHRIRMESHADRLAISAALVGVFMFVYIAVVIYGKALAGRLQREIDDLRKLREACYRSRRLAAVTSFHSRERRSRQARSNTTRRWPA